LKGELAQGKSHEVDEEESGELAAALLQRTLLREQCTHNGLVLATGL
jgi:hypothetical protein